MITRRVTPRNLLRVWPPITFPRCDCGTERSYMIVTSLDTGLEKLTDIQRQAVEWDQGPLLVLAGPGSGKTQVLTCRIARLLDGSKNQNFRVLALTFTNKAADEMKGRVATFVPGLEERANIGTFHSF